MVCTRSHIEHRPRKHSLLIRIHRDRPTRVDLRMLPAARCRREVVALLTDDGQWNR